MTWEQQLQQRSFPQVCPGEMPVRSTIHPVGNTVRPLVTSQMVGLSFYVLYPVRSSTVGP